MGVESFVLSGKALGASVFADTLCAAVLPSRALRWVVMLTSLGKAALSVHAV